MANDIKVIANRSEIVAIADAVRNKTGITNEMTLSGIVGGIGSIRSNPTLQSKSATPSTVLQTITPDSGYDGLSSVTVDAIPSSYVQPTKTGRVTTNATYNVREYKSLTVDVPSSGSSLPTSTISGFGSAVGGTWYYIDANGQGQQYKATDWPTVKAIKGSYIIADFAYAASGFYLDGFELVHAYGPVVTTVEDGAQNYVIILKITGDNPTAMI